MNFLPVLRKKGAKAGLLVLYIGALFFFYYKYVPIVRSFQIVFLPILILVTGLTWRNVPAGTLSFIFFFPLINNLPYFFGIAEPIPHAPTALVLFLFYFLGFILSGRSLEGERPFDRSLLPPLRVFVLIAVASGVIGFFRYANFWPFLSDRIYELTTNRYGVRSGGAIMSVVFSLLNYASGIALFLIVRNLPRTKDFLRKSLLTLGVSSLISLSYGLFQQFGHLSLGNNPTSIRLHLINGTFKDALSFGTYLSMAVPLFVGVFLTFRERFIRILSFLIVLLSFFAILYTGSKSGFGGLVISFAGFLIFGLGQHPRRVFKIRARRPLSGGAIIIIGLLIIGLGAGVFFLKSGVQSGLKSTPVFQRFLNAKNMLNWRVESLWKPALRMAADYPLTGVGIGSYIIEVANYSNLYQPPKTTPPSADDYQVVPESAENYVLQIVSELGAAGILALSWIVIMILRQIRSGLRAVRPSSWKYLFWGAICSLISFVVNAQTHTYIGSYEIKYTLWLLVGLIFALPKIADEAGLDPASVTADPSTPVSPETRRTPRVIWKKALVPVLILVFSVIHLWNSTHSLSLAARTKEFGLDRSFGLGRIEKTVDGREFQWTSDSAGIPVKIERPLLVVPIHASHPDIDVNPVVVRFVLIKDFFKSKRRLKDIRLTNENWREIGLPLASEVGNEAVLLITVSRTWNPLKMTGVPDPRDLGIAVGRIEFRDRQ